MVVLLLLGWWVMTWQDFERADCVRFPMDERCRAVSFVPAVPVAPVAPVPFRRFGVPEVPRHVVD